jgi:DNA-binding NarL/FixJ family response regulator
MIKRRVVIVDGDEEFQLLVSSVLRFSDRFVLAAKYTDPGMALKGIIKDKPDIVITDLYFSGIAPIEYLKLLVDKLRLIEVFVVSDIDDESIVMDAIQTGVIGYMLKKNAFSNILMGLDIISQGGSPIDPAVARKVITTLKIAKATPLTRRESAVLKRLIQGKTYSMIADELSISLETSKTHIKNIYRKLQVKSKTEAVKKAISERLVLFS